MTQTDTSYPQRVIVSNDEELRAVTELLNVLRGMDRAELLRTAWQVTLRRSGSSIRSTILLDGTVMATQA